MIRSPSAPRYGFARRESSCPERCQSPPRRTLCAGSTELEGLFTAGKQHLCLRLPFRSPWTDESMNVRLIGLSNER
jgi:hypothetical protein